MKFVTYTNIDGETPRFGFKRGEKIIDVIRSGIWVNENKKDSSFLTIPTTLKLALVNWDRNFYKFKNFNLLFQIQTCHQWKWTKNQSQ